MLMTADKDEQMIDWQKELLNAEWRKTNLADKNLLTSHSLITFFVSRLTIFKNLVSYQLIESL